MRFLPVGSTWRLLASAVTVMATGVLTQVRALGADASSVVAVEAEEFKIEKGWKVIRVGEGNYNIDVVGFCHMGGERLLQADAADSTASAVDDVNIPAEGNYVMWVRYEYPAFTEMPFKVVIEQGGKTIAEKIMGRKDNPRLCFNDPRLRPQYDPPWGPEGTAEEPMDVNGLRAGPARIRLLTVAQTVVPGISANRNIDLIYMTGNTEPLTTPEGKPNPQSWWAKGGGAGATYPILNMFRDARGARWEVQVVNKGTQPMDLNAEYVYNRVPWGASDPVVNKLAAGQTSSWVPLGKQDTTHFSMVKFSSPGPFELQIRPCGGKSVGKWEPDGGAVRIYIPPYPGYGENPRTTVEEIDKVLEHLKQTPAPGKNPTVPLAYGGWIFADHPGQYGSKYCELYKAIGMRAIPSTIQDKSVMAKIGLPVTKSAQAMAYRQFPTGDQISKVKATFEKNGLLNELLFFDYGDEILFSEWVPMATGHQKAQIPVLWTAWYAKRFPGKTPPAPAPDSSAKAAESNPRLYVDSVMFFEDIAIDWVAAGNKDVKRILGPDVLAGANYSGHPFYYPMIAMYVHWFRRGAADWGRHSDYFWEVAQPGPMINGYMAEHFRAGMRFNPKAVNRQYTMPHSPGNTEASFLRTAFTHLAHGAKMLDYFGIGMDECFTENHIDHRDKDRYRQIRDVNYSMALVEYIQLQSQVVPSETAILLSDSTERWDVSGIAGDMACHNQFGADFRKLRMSYHMERVGLWMALTFAGVSPDLVVEEDLTEDRLKGTKLLFVVGDSIPPGVVPALGKFAINGGTIVATVGAGRFDAYREANPAMESLLGITSRKLEEKDRFFRPLQELQFLKQLDTVTGDGWKMPVLAVQEQIKPAADTEVVAKNQSGGPAVISKKVGKGRIIYVSALPGVAYLWSAYQPPIVADRGANTHKVPVNFDAGARALIGKIVADAGIEAPVQTGGSLIDTRLIKSGKTYMLPVANYNEKVGDDVAFSLKIEGTASEVISAYRGKLDSKTENGRLVFTVPKLGYGDMIRINVR